MAKRTSRVIPIVQSIPPLFLSSKSPQQAASCWQVQKRSDCSTVPDPSQIFSVSSTPYLRKSKTLTARSRFSPGFPIPLYTTRRDRYRIYCGAPIVIGLYFELIDFLRTNIRFLSDFCKLAV